MTKNEIIKLKKHYQHILMIKKINAHGTQGNTTRRRIGKKDASKSIIHGINKKIDRILLFKNQLKIMPELVENVKDFNMGMEFLDLWFQLKISSKSMEKHFIA